MVWQCWYLRLRRKVGVGRTYGESLLLMRRLVDRGEMESFAANADGLQCLGAYVLSCLFLLLRMRVCSVMCKPEFWYGVWFLMPRGVGRGLRAAMASRIEELAEFVEATPFATDQGGADRGNPCAADQRGGCGHCAVRSTSVCVGVVGARELGPSDKS